MLSFKHQIVFEFFRFPDYDNKPQDWLDQSAEDAHSSMAPYPSSIF